MQSYCVVNSISLLMSSSFTLALIDLIMRKLYYLVFIPFPLFLCVNKQEGFLLFKLRCKDAFFSSLWSLLNSRSSSYSFLHENLGGTKTTIHFFLKAQIANQFRADFNLLFFPFPSHMGDNGGWLALCWRHLCQTSDLRRWRKGYRMHSHTHTHTHAQGFYLISSYLTMIFIIIFYNKNTTCKWKQ